MRRLCFDIDGTICYLKEPNQTYEECVPVPHMIQLLRNLKKQGYTIILNTARGMASKASMNKIVRITFKWLEEHSVPYDEIYFQKPNADIYIDDKACNLDISSIKKMMDKKAILDEFVVEEEF
jgi:capsule biosynthesis phosphatase